MELTAAIKLLGHDISRKAIMELMRRYGNGSHEGELDFEGFKRLAIAIELNEEDDESLSLDEGKLHTVVHRARSVRPHTPPT